MLAVDNFNLCYREVRQSDMKFDYASSAKLRKKAAPKRKQNTILRLIHNDWRRVSRIRIGRWVIKKRSDGIFTYLTHLQHRTIAIRSTYQPAIRVRVFARSRHNTYLWQQPANYIFFSVQNKIEKHAYRTANGTESSNITIDDSRQFSCQLEQSIRK